MDIESNFEISFLNSRFLTTSQTAANANRLNWRAEVLLTRNRQLIEGKRVLDIASHDGRFSYASLRLGAAHVTGVEGRQSLVSASDENLKNANVKGTFEFRTADIFDYLPTVKPGEFDTILCLGFFYHIVEHAALVEQLVRLRPAHIILDTNVAIHPTEKLDKLLLMRALSLFKRFGYVHPLTQLLTKELLDGEYLLLKQGDPENDAFTIAGHGMRMVPTKRAVEFMFQKFGCEISEINWHASHVDDWEALSDYKRHGRVSYIMIPPRDMGQPAS